MYGFPLFRNSCYSWTGPKCTDVLVGQIINRDKLALGLIKNMYLTNRKCINTSIFSSTAFHVCETVHSRQIIHFAFLMPY